MSTKKNYWAQVISSMNGMISFGGLSPKEDVTHSIELRALDGRHFISMEEDGPRQGWTTMNSPGATMIHCGSDLAEMDDSSTTSKTEKEAFVLIANNGDIQLKATNGKIRIEALDIEFCATGNAPQGQFWVNANESIKLDSKNITIDAKGGCKILTTGLMTISGGLATAIFSPIISGVSAATISKALPLPGKILGDLLSKREQ